MRRRLLMRRLFAMALRKLPLVALGIGLASRSTPPPVRWPTSRSTSATGSTSWRSVFATSRPMSAS